MAQIDSLLRHLKEHDGSDLHLVAGQPPRFRSKGSIREVEGQGVLASDALRDMMQEVASKRGWDEPDGGTRPPGRVQEGRPADDRGRGVGGHRPGHVLGGEAAVVRAARGRTGLRAEHRPGAERRSLFTPRASEGSAVVLKRDNPTRRLSVPAPFA